MVQVANGTGSTLKMNELSPRLLEAFFILEKESKEQDENRVTITTDFNANTASVSFNFEANHVIDEVGNVIFSSSNYLDSVDFVAGEGSDVKGDNLIQNVFEMLHLVRNYEQSTLSNPNGLSRLSATYDYTSSTFSGTMEFELEIERKSNGMIEIQAIEYLQ